MNEERDYWAWASTIEGIYYDKLKQLVNIFGGIKKLYNAGPKEYIQNAIELEWQEAIIRAKEKFIAKKFYDSLKKKEIQFVTIKDKAYPYKLSVLKNCPFYLFYRGVLPDERKKSVAMVGARSCSNYGRNMARTLAKELSDNHVQIISGMARGIDTYSHLGALEGATPTFAILGCGADCCYPSENIELYNDIIKKGGIISEYAPGDEPEKWHFPQRNRIISGLSDQIVVVEAKEKSGSLITVEWALEQGKDVMAVPGRVCDKLSSGCNRLIRAGAGLVTCADDVLNELGYEQSKVVMNQDVVLQSYDQKLLQIYNCLDTEPINIQMIIEKTHLEYGVVTGKLLQLQLMGLIDQPVEGYYEKK